MFELTEPQVWTLIGVFAAGLFGTLTLIATLFVGVIRSEIGGLRSEIGGLRSEMGSEIGGLRSEMGGEMRGLRGEIVHLRNEMNTRIDALDRDVQALVKHTFGLDRG